MSVAAPYRKGATRMLQKALRVGMLCAVALVCSGPAAGQVFELTGGSSSLLNAEGGSLEVHAANYTGRIDLGYLGRPSLGFSFLRPYKKSLIEVGDQQIPFVLPTDLFDH